MQALLKKLSGYRHIIWDWNGTLINDAPQVLHIVNELLEEQGLNTITLDEYRDRFTHPVSDFYKGLGFNFEAFPFDELCLHFNDKYGQRIPYLTLHEDAQEVASHIAQGQWTQSILSAAPESALQEGVKTFGIENYFSHVYGLDNLHAASKVQRGHELIKKVGIPNKETILIGDTDHDLEVAEALGIDLILIAQGHQSFERLRKLHPNTLPGLKAA
ncbi:HAD family hydrolase [Sansalvadorimonas verongulae]|uniref:HAD family hydrolase n=1 Tax=Sansalvadorimonas verongulae TaxID=2172824 RepID=UPI0012BBB37A|nr:HAD family hydrolase [Sansalvadorimonas verongulae]MTI13672.1 HAD family hydrolase [Sansalvadorimonas verongulae]